MGRLIDVDAMMDDINNSLNEMTNIGVCVDGDWLWAKLNDAIENAPTIEPQRKTGHWILHPEQEKNIFGAKIIECSECGDKCLVQFVEKEKYCRNCGADMRGEKNDQR